MRGALLLLCLRCLIGSSVAVAEAPNVILLLVDDMGFGDIAAHGNPILRTPSFDRLHAKSARFTNFAVSPSCAPTRAALLTGRHEFLSGVTHTVKPMREMSLKSTTLAELFLARGYRTGMIGKWHLELDGPFHPSRRGFQETLTCVDDNYKKTHFNPTLVRDGVERKYRGYRTDIFFDEAIDFVGRHRDVPFFLYLATHSPHSPHKVSERYSRPYEAYRARYEGMKYGVGFFGMVANVDENLGRLMDRLKEWGLNDKTLVVAMNDNGGTGGMDVFNAGRRGVKGTAWSGGTRAYSYWSLGSRFSTGDRSQMAGHVDVLPTLAELCGLTVPDGLEPQLEGGSLLAALVNPSAELDEDRMQVHHVGRWPDPETWRAHKYAGCSVRWKHYTLVRMDPCGRGKCGHCNGMVARGEAKQRPSYTTNPEHHAIVPPGEWALFDLGTDPYQRNDLAGMRPGIAARLSAHYETWWGKVETALARRWGK